MGVVLLSAAGMLGAGVLAETKVEISNVHLCCAGCVKAVGSALKGVEGITGACDQKAKTVTITAPDDATAQKGIEALAAAGYHGRLDTKAVHFPRDSGATRGKVSSLTVTGIHNCCGACCKAIKAAVKKVPGVTGDTAKPKSNTFEVTGDYEATELIRALHAAGFHVKVKK
jgi:copper chaperone CopZ